MIIFINVEIWFINVVRIILWEWSKNTIRENYFEDYYNLEGESVNGQKMIHGNK